MPAADRPAELGHGSLTITNHVAIAVRHLGAAAPAVMGKRTLTAYHDRQQDVGMCVGVSSVDR